MDTRVFDEQIGDLTSALGDTTRRGIYISVREASEPVTASQIASLFDIHPNVARHHLDRLVGDGYLRVNRRHRTGKGGPGAGRPAKHYEATDKAISLQYPTLRYDLLSELLVRVVERLAPEDGPRIAEEIGREYGRELAAEVGLPDDVGFEQAVEAVARAMLGVGFETTAQPEDGTIVTRFCPFGETAANHPDVVCKLDQGIVRGLLEAAHQRAVAVVTPHQRAEDDCLTEM